MRELYKSFPWPLKLLVSVTFQKYHFVRSRHLFSLWRDENIQKENMSDADFFFSVQANQTFIRRLNSDVQIGVVKTEHKGSYL